MSRENAGENGILVIAVQDDAAAVEQVLGSVDLPVLIDDTGQIAAAYDIPGVPAHVFIDATGADPTTIVGPVSTEEALARLDTLR